MSRSKNIKHDGIQKMRDYVGCVVKLRCNVASKDGTEIIPKGTLWIVSSTWRGRLSLGRYGGPVIARVRPSMVHLVVYSGLKP